MEIDYAVEVHLSGWETGLALFAGDEIVIYGYDGTDWLLICTETEEAWTNCTQ